MNGDQQHEHREGHGSVAGALTSLVHALDRLDVDPVALTRSERSALQVQLAEVHGRVEAALCRVGAVAQTQGDHVHDGIRTAGAWLANRSEFDSRGAGRLLKTGRILRDMPGAEAAFITGRVGSEKVRLLINARADVEEQYAEDEDQILAHIEPLTVRHAAVAIARWRETALARLDHSPEGPPPDDPRANTASFGSGVGDEKTLNAFFHPIIGREAETLVDAEIRRLFEIGTFTTDGGLDAGQRRATALMELLRRGSTVSTEAGLPRRAVIVHVDLARILGIPARSVEELMAWPCELDDGTRVPLAEVLEVMGDATLTTVLGTYGLTGQFHPVGAITTARNANPTQRRMLRARDRGCAFPGCDAPAHWCQPHHEPPFERSHRTTAVELVLLCKHHHRLRHQEGWTITLGGDGTAEFRRPDGSLLQSTGTGTKIPVEKLSSEVPKPKQPVRKPDCHRPRPRHPQYEATMSFARSIFGDQTRANRAPNAPPIRWVRVPIPAE